LKKLTLKLGKIANWEKSSEHITNQRITSNDMGGSESTRKNLSKKIDLIIHFIANFFK
jgi:hypothetical protein